MDKRELRRTYSGHRILLTEDEVRAKSHVIANAAISLINWPSCKRLHLYRPEWNEVATGEILLYVRMRWPDIDVVIASTDKDAPQPEGLFDVVIVPVLCFDAHNTRLGRGSGWYDRFLATQPQAQTIGLAYDLSKAEHLPRELHDVPLRSIITESRVQELGI